MRVALLSGGKDSMYAAYRAWPVDLGLMLVYDAPRPSPHLLNLGKSVETIISLGIPLVAVRLDKGRERGETVSLLRRLGADEVVAGDVFIEDHLKYMESVAGEAGASLREPLWGMDTLELAYRIYGEGFRTLVIGGVEGLGGWVGRILDSGNIGLFVDDAGRIGADPLGENGEYHTLVLESPLHRREVSYRVVDKSVLQGYVVLRVV